MHKKTVLVTGASRGIGKSIAIEFAKKEYNVVITCSKTEKDLVNTKQEIERLGAFCISYVGDMGQPQDVRRLFAQIESRLPGVDILINNAGISFIGLLSEMSEDEWQHVMNVNLNSVFYCSKAVIPYMIHQKCGKIINISSVWGNVGASCEVAYSASKAGIHGFTKALAKELAPSNIQVNALALGVIDTSMNECYTVVEREHLKEEIPAGRFGTSMEVAEIVFSLAVGNDYMTGQIITVDGGWN